jgi:hypothetical protein
MFQIIHCVLDDNAEVVLRRPLQPLFELREDAIAMAELDSSRLWGERLRRGAQLLVGERFARPDASLRGRRGCHERRCGIIDTFVSPSDHRGNLCVSYAASIETDQVPQ